MQWGFTPCHRFVQVFVLSPANPIVQALHTCAGHSSAIVCYFWPNPNCCVLCLFYGVAGCGRADGDC